MNTNDGFPWVRSHSVTTGGKKYFYHSRTLNHWVVWDRLIQRWVLQTLLGTIAYFLSERDALTYVGRKSHKLWEKA
jgi:hypothetical protein